MKIVLVGLKLSIGMRLIMDALVDALIRQGDDVVVIGDRSYHPCLPVTFYPMTASDSYFKMFLQTLDIRLILKISCLIQQQSPDLCYIITSHSINGFILATVRTLISNVDQHTLFVSHLHDPIPHMGSRAAHFIVVSQWLQLRFSDYVTVYGEYLKGLTVKQYSFPKSRIIVIPPGACRPIRLIEPELRTHTWFSLIGRIEPYKGVDVFMEAASFVLQSQPDVQFLVGGAGNLRPYASLIAQLGENLILQNRVLSNKEIDTFMQRSWAVVLPYRDGSQSAVIPIAYCNACPVIVSNVGSLPELVREETGLVVEPNDSYSLAEAMLGVIDLDKRGKMGSAAFQFYRERLVWNDIIVNLKHSLAV